LNRHQFEISVEQREKLVRDFIGNNKGCCKETVIRGLQKDLSRKTVYKVIEMMKGEEKIEDLKEDKDRKSKLFLKYDNPLVSIQLELEEFEKSFFSLFNKAREKSAESMLMRSLVEFARRANWPQGETPGLLSTIDETQLLSEPLSIFYRMVDSYLIRSMNVWPCRIQDKESLNKVYEMVFMKIANLMEKIVEVDENGMAQFIKLKNEYALLCRLGGAASLMEYRSVFAKFGMKQEIEDVIDSLWKIDKDIQRFVYMEPKALHFKFRYGVDDWRNLLYLTEQSLRK
jgi:hypothetical protein